MSATFGSVREALAYYYSCRKGPRASRPRWSRDPSDDAREYRDPTTWTRIGRVLRGPNVPLDDDPDRHVGADVQADSELDDELRTWSLSDLPRSPSIRRAEERLRPLLRAAGLLAPPSTRNRVRRVDGEIVQPLDRRGSTVTTLREMTPRTSGADDS